MFFSSSFFLIERFLFCGQMSGPGGSALSYVSDEGTQRMTKGGREVDLD